MGTYTDLLTLSKHASSQKEAVQDKGVKTRPIDQPTKRPTDQPTNRRADEATKRPTDQSSGRRAEKWRKQKAIVRTAFDLYVDQAHEIRKIRAERELNGNKTVSYSEIAREAFELYFKATGRKPKPE